MWFALLVILILCMNNIARTLTSLRCQGLFRILHAYSASKRRNIHVLDNISADDLASFKSLNNILKNLELKGTIDKDMRSTLTQLLKEGQNYLKRTFKPHFSLDAACSDYCIQWTCTDPKDVKFLSV